MNLRGALFRYTSQTFRVHATASASNTLLEVDPVSHRKAFQMWKNCGGISQVAPIRNSCKDQPVTQKLSVQVLSPSAVIAQVAWWEATCFWASVVQLRSTAIHLRQIGKGLQIIWILYINAGNKSESVCTNKHNSSTTCLFATRSWTNLVANWPLKHKSKVARLVILRLNHDPASTTSPFVEECLLQLYEVLSGLWM